MSSSKSTKKVHYERGTKPGHNHRSSRDSGIGSSSASDRASVGEYEDTSFTYQQIQGQRSDVNALQDALNAAYETIRHLQADKKKLSESLADSNKENRQLKKEKGGLLDQVESLLVDLKEERKVNAKLRRETSPRSSTRTTPPRVEPPLHRSDGSSTRDRRASVRYDMPPTAPQPPLSPFSPINTGMPVTYAPPPIVTYAPASVSYSDSPIYASSSPTSTRSHYSASTISSGHTSDGRYRLNPV